MGYTPYKAHRMKSPLAQKPKAEPEGNKKNRNENKLETINQVTDQRADKYKKDVTGVGGLIDDTSLSNNQKIAQNKELLANMKKANKSSTDSINRVTAADLKFVNDNINDFSKDELDRMSKDGFFTKIN
tara:strand:+ start:69 stop:455 length:387 start_codon:yes stop_codon:yes gene_type:complete